MKKSVEQIPFCESNVYCSLNSKIEFKKRMIEDMKKLDQMISEQLGDVIIEFFKTKGFTILKYPAKVTDATVYHMYLKNKKDLPDIFNKEFTVSINVIGYYKLVNFNIVLKNSKNNDDGCGWRYEKEDFETFYNRKLKKLFEKKEKKVK